MLKTLLSRLRRNHALEHATINLSSQQYPAARIAGMSGPLGFSLYTTLSADRVIPLVHEALAALKAGQGHLAVHHNCGTNIVVTATLTTLASLLGIGKLARRPVRRLLERLPYAILLNTLALLAAPSIGAWAQSQLTTDPHLEDVRIGSIVSDYRGGLQRIRVHTVQK